MAHFFSNVFKLVEIFSRALPITAIPDSLLLIAIVQTNQNILLNHSLPQIFHLLKLVTFGNQLKYMIE